MASWGSSLLQVPPSVSPDLPPLSTVFGTPGIAFVSQFGTPPLVTIVMTETAPITTPGLGTVTFSYQEYQVSGILAAAAAATVPLVSEPAPESEVAPESQIASEAAPAAQSAETASTETDSASAQGVPTSEPQDPPARSPSTPPA